MPPPLNYSYAFRKICTLRDGRLIALRAPNANDAALLSRGFQGLSPESRYRRFFCAKHSLSPRELRYLTDVDMVQHVAIGAVSYDWVEGEEGLGMARYVQDRDDPQLAEAAVAVIDSMQGQGLGPLLFAHLGAAARERGVTRFRCELLADNGPMHQMLRTLHPAVSFAATAPGVHSVVLPLEALSARRLRTAGPLQRLFAHAASEVHAAPLRRRVMARLRDRESRATNARQATGT